MMFVILAKKKRNYALGKYINQGKLNKLADPLVVTHNYSTPKQFQGDNQRLRKKIKIKKKIENNIETIQAENKADNDKEWTASFISKYCCGCTRSLILLQLFSIIVWFVAFCAISFCLFFGIMFAFALDNDELAAAWLSAVIWSLIFWLFISRPILITVKVLIAKCKLEKKARRHHASIQWQAKNKKVNQNLYIRNSSNSSNSNGKVSGEYDDIKGKNTTRIIEMTAVSTCGSDENGYTYDHFSTDVMSPKIERMPSVKTVVL